jgi:O-antigen ligase
MSTASLQQRLFTARFFFLCLPVLVGPWLFGAWEMWWFWPFTLSVFLSSLLFGLDLLLNKPPAVAPEPVDTECSPTAFTKGAAVALFYAVFLLYAGVRALQADVWMEAERSFLLHLTPFLIGLQVLYGFETGQRRRFLWLIVANLALLGLYGIVNHALTGSRFVLWEEGYRKYFEHGRASGSYFCPDHFAGAMELALALGLGLALTRREDGLRRGGGAALCLIALTGVILSKSRGGGLTVVVVLVAALIWGFMRWPARKRWWWRISAATSAAIVLVVFWNAGTGYAKRFSSYFTIEGTQEKTIRQIGDLAFEKARATSRGRMIGGALRAWRDAPVFGIGPGMHQHLWPHYAASSDVDRESGIWPSLPNYNFHSYEVHSDWVQLLEEYGVVGLLLFLLPAATLFIILVRSTQYSAALLGGILAFLAMAFHSLGDFNLQMPATTWMFGAILALAASDVTQRLRRRRHSKSSHYSPGRKVTLGT